MFDFSSPLFLILLVAIPFLIYPQLRTNVVSSKWRKRITLLLRCIALFLVILSLANLHRTKKEQRLAVLFLLDISDSIAPSQQVEAINQINNAIAKMKSTDQFGVISFSKEPSVIINMGTVREQPSLPVLLPETTIEKDSTDILTTLKRSLELLPEEYHRRIVLFSDGINNVNGFSIKDYLPYLSASGVEIMTVPLKTVNDSIRVHELQLPNIVRKGQTFEIHAMVESDGSIPKVNGTLYHNDAPVHDIEFTLQQGLNELKLPLQQVWETRLHTYHLKLNVSDEISENNQAEGVVLIRDKPHVLYIENELEQIENLKVVLEENGFIVNVIPATEIPTELIVLQQYHIVILSNISADILSSQQMDMLDSYVRDLGHGLVVIGGGNAFGPGGYTDTKIEDILPVEMTPRERKDSVALYFIIDTSGSMANYVGLQTKLELAIEAIRSGILNLAEEDKVGIISFSAGRKPYIISKLTSDHNNLIEVVGRLKPTGGTTAMKEAISTAVELLNASEEERKHIILLSDGKSTGEPSEFVQVAEAGANEGIKTSTIAIGGAAQKDLLREIASAGNGQSRFVENVQELPKVLVDTVRETQNYIIQEQFIPVITNSDTPILANIETFPLLYGYVATSEKSAADVFLKSHKDDPILTGWYYGLGKCVVWTSDIKPAWSKDMISWENFGKFWGQVVNWTLPSEGINVDFDLNVYPRDGSAEVVINTQNSELVSYIVQVAGPKGSSQSVMVHQENLNRYVGEFQMKDSGSYIITAKPDDESILTQTLSLSYPIEYTDFKINVNLLMKLAQETGGIFEPTLTEIAAPAGVSIEKRISLSHIFMIVAVVLFVLEMILRRFSIASGYIAQLREQLVQKSDDVIPNTLTQLNKRKVDLSLIPNIDMHTSVDDVSPSQASPEQNSSEELSPQSSDSTVSRLLAVKRRSHSV